MVKKIFLFVCPEAGCSAISKGANECPNHHKPMKRECYVLEHYKPAGSSDSLDYLSKLFGAR